MVRASYLALTSRLDQSEVGCLPSTRISVGSGLAESPGASVETDILTGAGEQAYGLCIQPAIPACRYGSVSRSSDKQATRVALYIEEFHTVICQWNGASQERMRRGKRRR